MPQALAVDWSAVQATYAATGGDAEATAKAHGIQSAAVRQRAKRGQWKALTAKALAAAGLVAAPVPAVPAQAKPTHAAVSQAVTTQLEKHGIKAKKAAALAVSKGMGWAARQEGQVIVAAAPSLASLGKLAQTARLPGWEAASPSGNMLGISLNVTVGQDQPVIDVDATVEPGPLPEQS